MASPWFEALTVPYPDLPVDQVERFARGSIDEFVQYLRRAKSHQETTAIRVAWQRDEADQEPHVADGVWVELCAPAGENDRFERDLRKFFGDQVREVYEASPDEAAVAFDESRKIAVLDADENTGEHTGEAQAGASGLAGAGDRADADDRAGAQAPAVDAKP